MTTITLNTLNATANTYFFSIDLFMDGNNPVMVTCISKRVKTTAGKSQRSKLYAECKRAGARSNLAGNHYSGRTGDTTWALTIGGRYADDVQYSTNTEYIWTEDDYRRDWATAMME